MSICKTILTAFVFIFLYTGVFAQTPKVKLIAYWSFDDSTVNDHSGNGYHGTIVNHPVFVPGVHGHGLALKFQGKNNYIPVGGNPANIGDHVLLPQIPFDTLKEFTLMFWANEKDFSYPAGEGYVLFGWSCCNDGWLGVDHCGNDVDVCCVNYSVGSDNHYTDPYRYMFNYSERGTWIHYALTYKNAHFKAYRNGVLVGEQDQAIKVRRNVAGMATHWWTWGEDRQSARYTGMLDEVKIYNVAFDKIDTTVETKSCSGWSFEYKDFAKIDTLNLVVNARQHSNFIRLAQAGFKQRGAVWYNLRLPVNMGFTTEFDFRLSQGSNVQSPDGSLPGADGIAFVIQNSNVNECGWIGGGIGYSGIPNSLAIEFDTFSNDSNQIENLNDINGNHIAVQSLGSQPNSAVHDKNSTLAVNPNIMSIRPDSTVYHVKIEYSPGQKTLDIYLDTSGTYGSPALTLNNFEINKYVTPDKFGQAYIGLTSATGSAYENHDILKWKYCTSVSQIVGVEEDYQDNGENVVTSPSPAYDYVNFNIKDGLTLNPDLIIYDIYGREIENSGSMFSFSSPNVLKWDTKSVRQGIYFYKLKTSESTYTGKIVVLK